MMSSVIEVEEEDEIRRDELGSVEGS